MRRVCGLSVLLAVACTSAPDPTDIPDTDTDTDTEPMPTPSADCPDDSPLTWENYGEPFLLTWCTPCHSSQVDDGERSGAPVGIDFDTLEKVRQHAEAISRTSIEEGARMPPAGGVPEEDLDSFAEWLACGLPGTPEPPSACSTRTWFSGGATITSEAEAVQLCSEANAVEGVLQLTADVTIDCLCEVTGGIQAGDGVTRIDLPLLESVGAGLDFTGHQTLTSVSAPTLYATGSDLYLRDMPALTTVELPGLVTLGGDLRIEHADALTSITFDRLESVQGDLRISDNDALQTFELRRVSDIAGTLLVSHNPSLVSADVFTALRSIGDRLQLVNNDGIQTLDGFQALLDVDSGIYIRGNDSLRTIGGFQYLLHIGGTLEVSDNDALTEISAFTQVIDIRHGLHILDNDALQRIHGFVYLEDVGLLGDWRDAAHQLRLVSNPSLTQVLGFDSLRRAGGITVRDNASLVNIQAELDLLNFVMREIDIRDNPQLTSLNWLSSPSSVGTNLDVIDNASLPSDNARSLVRRIGTENIWGTVTIEGNAP